MKIKNILIGCVFLVVCSCAGAVPQKESNGISHTAVPGSIKKYKVNGKYYQPLASSRGFTQEGIASWYGKKFHGRKTASGEVYNMYAMTGAHKTLPLGTYVKVHNLANKKQAVLKINDRGPFIRGRIIDLSYKAAKKLGVAGPGTAPVKIYALGQPVRESDASKKVRFRHVDYWTGNFTVQVGAFKVRQNALNLNAKLMKRYGNSAHITTHTDYRGTFYRVRVGQYTSLEKAANFRDRLLTSGASNAFVVAE